MLGGSNRFETSVETPKHLRKRQHILCRNEPNRQTQLCGSHYMHVYKSDATKTFFYDILENISNDRVILIHHKMEDRLYGRLFFGSFRFHFFAHSSFGWSQHSSRTTK